ncbi:MAG: BrnT family toxin [bacterium]|nr:BrnT family toxin [bacterium]
MRILPEPITFEWDKGNIDKNFIKHKVTNRETEEIFISDRKFILEDNKHSLAEKRYMIWGRTNMGRRLTVFFTIRNQKIRIISARDMHSKERGEYEKNIKTGS